MTTFFSYAAFSAILAVILAVARDVPILNVLALPDVDVRPALSTVLCLGFLVAMVVGWGPSSPVVAACAQATVWLGALAYFWWSVAWHLRERR